MSPEPIDPAVYASARGTGIAAFVAFFQIAIFGYLVYVCFYLSRQGSGVLAAPISAWQVYMPAWIGLFGAFRSDRLTRSISTVVLLCGAFSLVGFVAFGYNRGIPITAMLTPLLLGALAGFLFSEIIRTYLPSYRVLYTRKETYALLIFALMVVVVGMLKLQAVAIVCAVLAAGVLGVTRWVLAGGFSRQVQSTVAAASFLALLFSYP